MAENKPETSGNAQPSIAEYKKSQQRVRDLVERRRNIERHLLGVEDAIAQKEMTYLESTPSGNIITGFDNYMKGQSGAAAQRKKAGPLEQNRVFSKSSISYKPNANGDSAPGSAHSSHAPTPVSASFKESGNGTPSGNGTKSNRTKKGNKETEESENDSGTGKKRTNFGARK